MIGFQTNGTGLWQLEGGLEHLTIAGAMSDIVLHHHLNLVPVLRLVLLKSLVRSGHQVIAALQLRPAQKDPAVGVHRGAKLEAKDEVLRKFLLGPQLAQVRSLGRIVIINYDLPVLGRIAPITGFNLAVKTLGGLVLPTRQVLAGNERKKSWFQLKRVGLSRTGK